MNLAALSERRPQAWPLWHFNRERGRGYVPHHADEVRFVFDDGPRYALAKGGEGGGKSVAGIVKALERVRRGMSGVMGSPDFEHFGRSLWPEFKRWCPWNMVVDSQRHRQQADWKPSRPFDMVFDTDYGKVTVLMGGFKNPGSWEGPNVNWAMFDEARQHKTPDMLKVLDGRIRIPGPNGEPPQLWITTTPRMNWLFDYFGPVKTDEPDQFEAFKANSLVVDLLTADNEAAGNLEEGFTAKRAQTLTEAERRVLLEAAWEDIDNTERFLPSMTLWDACREELPPVTRRDGIVLALDAGVSGDSFGVVGVSRHPVRARGDDVAVRYVQEYRPQGRPLDFPAIEQDIIDLRDKQGLWIVQIVYDPYQLHQMAQRLEKAGFWVEPMSQGAPRLAADKNLFDLITQRRLAHDGDRALRQHIANADAKRDGQDQRLRLVKRVANRKIDLAVALSMASYQILELNL